MFSQRFKNSTAFIFLFTFLLLKVAGLHSFSHQDDLQGAEDCVWCHLSGTDTHTPVIPAEETYEIATPVVVDSASEEISFYNFIPSSKKPVCLIFNKPPPFYTV